MVGLTRERAIAGAACVTAVVVAVAAFLGWWHVALTVMAFAQAAVIVALLDVRRRMARSHDVRKIAGSFKSVERRLDNLGARMLAAAETSRVEVADKLAEIARTVEERKVVETTLRANLENVAAKAEDNRAKVEAWAAELEVWRHGLDVVRSGVGDLGKRVDVALTEAEKDREQQDKRQDLAAARYIRQSEALIQLYEWVRPRCAMPSLGGWALDPTGVLTLLEIVRRRQPGLVVELGSGTSTIWLGYALEQLGSGRLVTIDHDERFAEQTRTHVRTHGLEELVEVRVAPLVDADLPGHATRWYDHTVMADLTDIDLLVIDGPPRSTGSMARYPAAVRLRDQLGDGAVVALDDATRPDEREVVQRWREEIPELVVSAVPPGDALKVLTLQPSGDRPSGVEQSP
ncbi:class I SAM-dependent methyltransferase [Jiangella asiatica]|nr:class I SAM-dependent methyltransferase [Jiangella asiatica]